MIELSKIPINHSENHKLIKLTYGLQAEKTVIIGSIETSKFLLLMAMLSDPPLNSDLMNLLCEINETGAGDDGGEHEGGQLVGFTGAAVWPLVVVRVSIVYILDQATTPSLKEKFLQYNLRIYILS